MPLFIGLMSGTSADGIDGVLVDLDADGGLRIVDTHQQTIPDPLRARVLDVQAGAAATPDELCALDVELGELFAQAAGALLARHGSAVVAIGSHGQTVRHAPAGPFPFSAQLGDPSVIAERTRITKRFRSYVDPALVDWVIEHPEQASLTGQTGELTVVFTDLAGFTTLSEKLREKTVGILNEYMELMEIGRAHV